LWAKERQNCPKERERESCDLLLDFLQQFFSLIESKEREKKGEILEERENWLKKHTTDREERRQSQRV